MDGLIPLVNEVSCCEICKPFLSLGPRPIIQVAESAKILIIGQAPGAKVHASGIPFDDASGDRLRSWMGVDTSTFYDASKIAIMPMGFCYPGKGKSGDLPPRSECAPQWHSKILAELPNIKITLLVGQYAQKYYLKNRHNSLTETVIHWHTLLPEFFPLPHPSPRNRIWMKKNPWFEKEAVPALRQLVSKALFMP